MQMKSGLNFTYKIPYFQTQNCLYHNFKHKITRILSQARKSIIRFFIPVSKTDKIYSSMQMESGLIFISEIPYFHTQNRPYHNFKHKIARILSQARKSIIRFFTPVSKTDQNLLF